MSSPPNGVYKIINVASNSSVRSYNASDVIYVASTLENPGPFELWTLTNNRDGSVTFLNLGLNQYAAVVSILRSLPSQAC